jgi:hypothetical protein
LKFAKICNPNQSSPKPEKPGETEILKKQLEYYAAKVEPAVIEKRIELEPELIEKLVSERAAEKIAELERRGAKPTRKESISTKHTRNGLRSLKKRIRAERKP